MTDQEGAEGRPSYFRNAARCTLIAAIFLAMAACGGTDSPTTAATAKAPIGQYLILDVDPGVSPFISILRIAGESGTVPIAGAGFTIAPKPGSVSKAVNVFYSIAALESRNYVQSSDPPGGTPVINLPVYGLYANYANQVTVTLTFQDGSTQALPVTIATSAYTDPTNIYSAPVIRVARTAGSSLGFDFFFIKSGLGSPVIVDTDGEIRWVVPGQKTSLSTALDGDQFLIGDAGEEVLHKLRLDGTTSQEPLSRPIYTDFHHNIDKGKAGYLAEFDATTGSVKNIENNIAEIDDSGLILKQWDLGAIISAYMTSQGDDPTLFVRPGIDWFHNNASTYDPRDDSLIVSSRENFLIKLDYSTGNIIWILGDPTKYWYTFASLRAKALTLNNGGLYPAGQHAVSITSDGYVMIFNDGLGSLNQPAGQSGGIARAYSAVSAYAIDAAALTATEVFDFDYGQSVYSSICSSAYEAADKSLLVDYATADLGHYSRLVGLDDAQNVVFDFQYPDTPCMTAWNSVPIALEHLVFD